MSIIRTHKNKDFTTICNKGIRDKNLSWKAKGILAYILTLPDDWQVYVSELQSHAKDGRDGTSSGINELISLGYITREVKRADNGSFLGYEYHIYETAEDKPKSDSPITEKPISGNTELLNTNLTNKLNIRKTNTTPTENSKALTTKKTPSEVQSTELYNKIKNYFEEKQPYKRFKSYPKEGSAIKALIKSAKERDPGNEEIFIFGMIQKFEEMRNNDPFFGKQPFLPSMLNSAGIFDRVLNQAYNDYQEKESAVDVTEGLNFE